MTSRFDVSRPRPHDTARDVASIICIYNTYYRCQTSFMRVSRPLLATILLVWAGLALGGNIIAAPAKFQVDSLTLSQLLLVGRAQFEWLRIAELGFASVTILLCAFVDRRLRILGLLAVTLFGLQHFGLHPKLEARTDLVLSGAPATDRTLHVVFVVFEIVKVVVLVVVGALQIIRHTTSDKGV